MPDIAAQIETTLAVMRLFDQIKTLLPEGLAAIRHYPNATEEEKTAISPTTVRRMWYRMFMEGSCC